MYWPYILNEHTCTEAIEAHFLPKTIGSFVKKKWASLASLNIKMTKFLENEP